MFHIGSHGRLKAYRLIDPQSPGHAGSGHRHAAKALVAKETSQHVLLRAPLVRVPPATRRPPSCCRHRSLRSSRVIWSWTGWLVHPLMRWEGFETLTNLMGQGSVLL